MSSLYPWLLSSPLTKLLAVLPIAVFYVYFFALRLNIPWFDDFENIPFFLEQFLDTPSFRGKMAALVRPNNEHRVVYARLVVLVQYALSGRLNFANLMLWGNSSLVLLFYLLYRALLQHETIARKALVGVLPVSLLLFSAQMYLMTFTAMFSLQYLSIIMLSMLSLFTLAIDRPIPLGVALGLALLSSFSMGNGLMVWPAGVGILLIQQRWTALGVWVASGMVTGYGYFLGYPVEQGNAVGFSYVIEHPVQTIAGFIILAGSAFDLFPTLPIAHRLYLPFLAGLTGLMGSGYWLLQTLFSPKKNTSFFASFVVGCLLFLLGTLALMACFRIRFGFAMVLHIPYRIYSLTLWSVAGVLLFSQLPERNRMRYWPALCGGILALNILSYLTYIPLAVERRKHMQGLSFNQAYNGVGLGGSRAPGLRKFIVDQLTMMKHRGWYELPDPVIAPDERLVVDPVNPPLFNLPLQINSTPDYILISTSDWAYEVGYNQGVYVVLKSDRYTYLMFAEKKRPLGFKPWQYEGGFVGAIAVQMIQPGRYQVGLFSTYPDHTARQFTDQFIDVY